jgi:large conductance mechanosensitive channel
MLKGFREFVFRGNVIDLAVAVIIGAAFTAIVNSFVKDIITPLIAATVGKPDFGALVLDINGGKITYGNFLNAVVSFVLVAAVVYFVIVLPATKLMAKLHPDAPATPTTKACPECLSEIPLAAKRCAHCGQPVSVAA